MTQDTTFYLPRFAVLLRKELAENWKSYMLRALMVFGVTLIAFLWNAYTEYKYAAAFDFVEDDDPVWYFEAAFARWGLFIWGCSYASLALEHLKSKAGRTAFLMTPATPLEKFLLYWLLTVVGFLLFYAAAVLLADWARTLVYMAAYPDLPILPVDWTAVWSVPEVFNSTDEIRLLVCGYFFLQSFFMLGSSVWPRNSFLKTFAAGMGIAVLYIAAGNGLYELLLPEGYYLPDNPDEHHAMDVLNIGLCLLTVVDWVLAYYRFKESEIINRW